MSEFEDRLGAILGNPDAMAQIMSLAQNLGGGAPADPPPNPVSPPQEPSFDGSDLLGMLGDVDPRMIQEGLQLFSQFSHADDERTALLSALRPFLKEDRSAKMDRAIQIARLSRMVRIALRLFQGKEAEDV